MDIGEKITNEELRAAIADLKRENNQETRKAYLSCLFQAKFLVPASFDPKPERDEQGKPVSMDKVKVSFKLLTNQKKDNFFPCFTDEEEFQAGINGSEAERVVLAYKELAKLVLDSNGVIAGFVINPNSDAMQMPAELIKKTESIGQSNISKKTIPANTKIRLRTPKYKPVDMMDAATEYFKQCPDVKAAYLQMIEKGDGDEEYLVTVDFKGDEKKLFEELLPKLKEYSFGIPVALTNTNNGLGAKVVENAEPFYEKESRE